MKSPSLPEKHLCDISQGWTAISAGKLFWKIHCDFNTPELLRRLASPENLIAEATEPLRKDTRPRNTFVARLAWPECHPQPLVLKHYRPLKLWRSLKDSRGSRAIAAFEKAFYLLRQNIVTALPIAASQTCWRAGRAESYLITELVPNARPLREFRQGKFSAYENRIVIRRLAEVIAQLHNSGLSHTDPTLSNFFVQDNERDKFRIVLIDLDGVRACPEISTQKTVEDLSPLFRRIPMSPREKFWFSAQYSRTRIDSIAPRQLLSLLAEKFDDDAKKPGATQLLQLGGHHWRARRGVLHPKILTVMKDPEAFLQQHEFYFKNSRVVTVSRVPASAPGEPNLVLRRLKYGKLGHRIKDTFRASRTQRALRHGLLLEQNGIATPRAYAAAEIRQLRLPTAAYLITEQIPDAQTLFKFLAQHPASTRIVALRLAELLARMHNKGFSHRDLKPTNILLDGNLNPFLIDLDGLRVWKSLTMQRAVSDLTRMAHGISRYQKELRFASWRFLKRYCQQREPVFCVREFAAQMGEKPQAE